MAEQRGIQEIKELIEGVKVLAITGKRVMADGRVNIADLPQLMILVQQQETLIKAFTGLADAKLEVQDIDGDEAVQVLMAIVAAAKEVQAAA